MFFVFGFGMGNVIAPASVVMQNALPLARAGAGSAVQGIPSPPAAPGDSGYRTERSAGARRATQANTPPVPMPRKAAIAMK